MSIDRDPQDDPFYGLGYTTPEDAEALHAQRLNDQDVINYSPPHARRRTGNVRSYRSDRDDEPLTGPLDLTEEDHERNRRGLALAREALRPSQERGYIERADGDENVMKALRRAHEYRRARDRDAS